MAASTGTWATIKSRETVMRWAEIPPKQTCGRRNGCNSLPAQRMKRLPPGTAAVGWTSRILIIPLPQNHGEKRKGHGERTPGEGLTCFRLLKSGQTRPPQVQNKHHQ